MDAERAYLFRHALLREAAQQLQLPRDRARLHGLAYHIIRQITGGKPQFAAELADHALQAAIEGDEHEWRRIELEHLTTAAQHAESGYANDVALALLQRTAAHPFAGADKAADVFCRMAALNQQLGRGPKVMECLSAAQALEPQLGDELTRAKLWLAVAKQKREWHNVHEAAELLRKAEPVFAAAGDKARLSQCVGHYAICLLRTGQLRDAAAHAQRAAGFARESGTSAVMALATALQANVLRQTGEDARVRAMYHEAIRIQRENGDLHACAITTGNLAIFENEAGNAAEAERLYMEAIALNRKVGDKRSEGVNTGNYGLLLRSAGRPGETEALLRRALAVFAESGDSFLEAAFLTNLGNLLSDEQRFAEAMATYRRSLEQQNRARNAGETAYNYMNMACCIMPLRQGAWRRSPLRAATSGCWIKLPATSLKCTRSPAARPWVTTRRSPLKLASARRCSQTPGKPCKRGARRPRCAGIFRMSLRPITAARWPQCFKKCSPTCGTPCKPQTRACARHWRTAHPLPSGTMSPSLRGCSSAPTQDLSGCVRIRRTLSATQCDANKASLRNNSLGHKAGSAAQRYNLSRQPRRDPRHCCRGFCSKPHGIDRPPVSGLDCRELVPCLLPHSFLRMDVACAGQLC
ncbi:MAG: tetratricopeptide repeat protein [Planctomycetes bacterium]|nr:tetratricopeptide repeat protein [Planctomycetota bacterium]MCW8135960.1 tetratricopeptide repeat protein [Planctomycetota bacterium]